MLRGGDAQGETWRINASLAVARNGSLLWVPLAKDKAANYWRYLLRTRSHDKAGIFYGHIYHLWLILVNSYHSRKRCLWAQTQFLHLFSSVLVTLTCTLMLVQNIPEKYLLFPQMSFKDSAGSLTLDQPSRDYFTLNCFEMQAPLAHRLWLRRFLSQGSALLLKKTCTYCDIQKNILCTEPLKRSTE